MNLLDLILVGAGLFVVAVYLLGGAWLTAATTAVRWEIIAIQWKSNAYHERRRALRAERALRWPVKP